MQPKKTPPLSEEETQRAKAQIGNWVQENSPSTEKKATRSNSPVKESSNKKPRSYSSPIVKKIQERRIEDKKEIMSKNTLTQKLLEDKMLDIEQYFYDEYNFDITDRDLYSEIFEILIKLNFTKAMLKDITLEEIISIIHVTFLAEWNQTIEDFYRDWVVSF